MTELTVRQMRQLTADLNPNRVAKRSGGGGSQLSYLEAWDVRATLTRIFGFGGWSADLVEPVKVLRIDDVPAAAGKSGSRFRVLTIATMRLSIHQTGATYTESAAASQVGTDIGEVTDFATKTSTSDALKRAAMNLGTQFGLSLYDNGSVKDVIKVVLAPGQQETLDEVRHPPIKPEERTPFPQGNTQADPLGAEYDQDSRALIPPAPGEDPRDDLPMAMRAGGR